MDAFERRDGGTRLKYQAKETDLQKDWTQEGQRNRHHDGDGRRVQLPVSTRGHAQHRPGRNVGASPAEGQDKSLLGEQK